MLNSFATVTLSERDKIVLLVLFCILLIIIFIIGLVSTLLINYYENSSYEIDDYVADYVNYGLVNNERNFKKVAHAKNRALLFKQSYLGLILLITSVLLLAIFCFYQQKSWTYIFDILADFSIKFDITTSNFFGLELINDWPKINENSFIIHNDVEGLIAYVFVILFILGAFIFIKGTIKYTARNSRINKKSKEQFRKSLDRSKSRTAPNNEN